MSSLTVDPPSVSQSALEKTPQGITSTQAAPAIPFASAFSVPPAHRDNFFYFSDVILRVEDTLYKIPRHVLTDHSDFFRETFSSGEKAEKGLCDVNPIVLPGVSSYDFMQLLRVLYARAVVPGVPLSIANASADQLSLSLLEWTSVLKLSHQWRMAVVHQFTIDKMTSMPMDPVDKTALAFKYDIKAWLKPALSDLAKRPQPMTRRDVDRLGLDTVLKIAEIRESITQSLTNGQMIVGKRKPEQLDFGARIEEVFPEQFPPRLETVKNEKMPDSAAFTLFGQPPPASNASPTSPMTAGELSGGTPSGNTERPAFSFGKPKSTTSSVTASAFSGSTHISSVKPSPLSSFGVRPA